MKKYIGLLFICGFFLMQMDRGAFAEERGRIEPGATGSDLLKVNLATCIDIALANNRKHNVSSLSVRIAEHQFRQALSAYWPKLLLNSSYSRIDDDAFFIFPEETSDYTISGIAPVPLTTTVIVPEKKVKVLDRDNAMGTLELSMPIYTGGMRKAIVDQAKSGIKAAEQAVRRTDLEIVYDVKRMFYSAVLCDILYGIGNETLTRLSATLDLTERLYKKGSGRVTKADYLRSKVFVESIRSAVVELESNLKISKAALINTMGLPWDTDIQITENEIPYQANQDTLETLIGNAYMFNPDWIRLTEGLKAAEAKIREEEGFRLPKVMLTGTLWGMNDFYEKGIVGSENRDGWNVGIGMQIPIFDGFLTTQKIKEARARLEKIAQEKILLKEGLALQIKHIFLNMSKYAEKVSAIGEAVRDAEENSELNIRAYRSELVEAEDVIEAQLMESFVKAMYYKTLYDYAEARFHIDFVIGREISESLG